MCCTLLCFLLIPRTSISHTLLGACQHQEYQGFQSKTKRKHCNLSQSLMDHLHWRSLLAKLSATATRDSHMIVLALATLDRATQIGSFLFFVALPKVTKAVTVTCHHRHYNMSMCVAVAGIIELNFANVSTSLKV
jgi:hypothetical protein